VQWELLPCRNRSLGSALKINTGIVSSGSSSEQLRLRLTYSTGPGSASSALQWLSPAQTSSGKYPFVLSQCQAIHSRSLLPLQDTCQCKVTYTARVKYPVELEVVMSAVRGYTSPIACPAPPDVSSEGFKGQWCLMLFNQQVPIAPYLIAIACGELTSSRLSPRCSVWAEPLVIDRARYEFEETEEILAAAEELCGPYRFSVYDLLMLPPSFPYGGMENPCMTFVTPTLLAGDRSQVSVVAHEIAHSWAGNLVTNHTWSDFWLNEGLTVYIENQLVRRLWGEEAYVLHVEAGLQSLRESVDRLISYYGRIFHLLT
jgi:leukotriene-A4 hydrolase